jgi:hypothetical protein
MKKSRGTVFFPNDPVVHLHLFAFVRKLDELGLENVTKIFQLRHIGGLAKKKMGRK